MYHQTIFDVQFRLIDCMLTLLLTCGDKEVIIEVSSIETSLRFKFCELNPYDF